MKYTYWHVIIESDDPKTPIGSVIGLKQKQDDLCRCDDITQDFIRYAKLKYLKRFPTEMQQTNRKELRDALFALAELVMVELQK